MYPFEKFTSEAKKVDGLQRVERTLIAQVAVTERHWIEELLG